MFRGSRPALPAPWSHRLVRDSLSGRMKTGVSGLWDCAGRAPGSFLLLPRPLGDRCGRVLSGKRGSLVASVRGPGRVYLSVSVLATVSVKYCLIGITIAFGCFLRESTRWWFGAASTTSLGSLGQGGRDHRKGCKVFFSECAVWAMLAVECLCVYVHVGCVWVKVNPFLSFHYWSRLMSILAEKQSTLAPDLSLLVHLQLTLINGCNPDCSPDTILNFLVKDLLFGFVAGRVGMECSRNKSREALSSSV